ncbi:MAG: alanine racemase [Alphaproteobacteria bacterium]|jgi:alanine racemase|nr:alanine racemase [Alphaproteobacteria bacterium]
MLKNPVVLDTLHKYGTCLVIDTKAIIANYNLVKEKSQTAEVSWVLKNNAYGLEVKNILPIVKEVNCQHIFVATLLEGIQLKEFADTLGYSPNVYILNPILPNQQEDLLANNLIPVLNTLQQIESWSKFAKVQGKKLPLLLHIETGINRLALSRDEVMYLYNHQEILEALDVRYIMSHFATASINNTATMDKQYNEFLDLAKYLPKSKYSLAASDALFVDKKYLFDLVRPAIALYGAIIADIQQQLTENALYLYSSIQQIKTLNIGEKVGYGHTWEAQRTSKIATLYLGYADGIPRSSKNAKVNIGGYACPIVGCMSMDLATIDITDLPEHLQVQGAIAEIIGENISLEDFSVSTNSLDCDILNRLTRRYPKVCI